MPENQTNVSVSQAFQNVPKNPNVASAPSADNTPSPQTAMPTQPQGNVTPPPPTAANVTPPAVTQPVQQPTVNADTQRQWDAIAAQQRLLEFQQQAQAMTRRNQELEAKVRSQDEAINNLLQTQREYDALKRTQEAANIDFSQLTTVDPEEAKYISASVMKAMQSQLDPLRQQIADQTKYLQQSMAYQEQRFNKQQAQDTLQRVMAKHPDFLQLQTNPQYQAYLQQRDGYSSQTIDDRAAEEFKRGNADYVIHMLDQFKQIQPAADMLTSVPPVQTATAPAAPPVTQEALPTLHDLNSMYQMRQITPDQYRDLLGKIRAAQPK